MSSQSTFLPLPARRIACDGDVQLIATDIAVETPIAIEFDGIGYAVMMATPADLEDFVRGFVVSERLIARHEALLSIDVATVSSGCIVRARLPANRRQAVIERARARVSESSCGLCGLESLEQVARPLPRAANGPAIADAAIFRAIGGLRDFQPLNARTGAVHASAFCGADGTILMLREDVGRHNALDKLIGAMLVAGIDPASGFLLTTSRCSYEMVEKSVLAGTATLVGISAATSLAVDRARTAGLRLVALARDDSLLDMHPQAGSV